MIKIIAGLKKKQNNFSKKKSKIRNAIYLLVKTDDKINLCLDKF